MALACLLGHDESVTTQPPTEVVIQEGMDFSLLDWAEIGKQAVRVPPVPESD